MNELTWRKCLSETNWGTWGWPLRPPLWPRNGLGGRDFRFLDQQSVLCRPPEPLHDARLEAGLLRDEDVPAARAAAAPEREAAGGPDVVVIERLRPQSAPARRRLRLSQRRLEAAETPSFADGAFCHSPSTFFTNLGRYFSDHKR